MRLRSFCLALSLAAACGSPSASADELYTLTLHNVDAFTGALIYGGTYTVITPTLLTSYMYFLPSDLASSVGQPLSLLEINPVNQACGPGSDPSNPPETGNMEGCIYYLLPDGARGGQNTWVLNHEGLYPGALIDVDIAPEPVPEAPSFLLVASGLLLSLASFIQRRRANTNPPGLFGPSR